MKINEAHSEDNVRELMLHEAARRWANEHKDNLKEETMDPIRSGIQNVLEGNLEQMRQNFNQALAQKAVEKLEEKKLEIASNYFGIK